MTTAVFVQKFFLARIERETYQDGEEVKEVRKLVFYRPPPTDEERKSSKPKSRLIGAQEAGKPDFVLVLFEADRWDKFELGKEYGVGVLV